MDNFTIKFSTDVEKCLLTQKNKLIYLEKQLEKLKKIEKLMMNLV
ncbi:MAG: hypothetical protein ACFFG0_02205 [Candidatus Thorarchaeota archaeon]